MRPACRASHSGDVDGDKDRREKDLLGEQQHGGGKDPAFDAESSSGSMNPNCLDSKVRVYLSGMARAHSMNRHVCTPRPALETRRYRGA